MNHDFVAAMRLAADLTRARDIAGATRTIQDALARRNASGELTVARGDSHQRPPTLLLVQPSEKFAGGRANPRSSSDADGHADRIAPKVGDSSRSPRLRRPLAEVVRLLREGRFRIGGTPGLPGMTGLLRTSPPPMVPDGAQFTARSFTCAAGTRSYKLYVPASASGQPQRLVIMLHGCRQDPDDFAAGTNMNAVAEANGLLVAYPAQNGAANVAACWNWFNPGDQMRDAGEPSIIAGITRDIISEFHVDGDMVFVAGLSAGGAMAAVMGETYPDLYAAVGIHSGLAYRSANDVVSAFAAMRGDAGLTPRPQPRDRSGLATRVRTIVFQGTADQVVRPANAGRIVDGASGHLEGASSTSQRGSSAGGRTYARFIIAGSDGSPAVECWMIDGAGHAWSGGSRGASYTDPSGPDASAEMVRFFLNL